MNLELIEKTEAFLKDTFAASTYLQNHPTDRDYRLEHSYRVANIAKAIAEAEEFDVTYAVIAGLLHDIAYCEEMVTREDRMNHGRRSAAIARPFLESLGLSADAVNEICYGIAIHVDDEADFEWENSFWDSSWQTVDPNRIAEYIDTFDMGEDNIITTLHQYGVQSICDAGCGCGIYALKLAANGFSVSGFDVSFHAVEIAQSLFEKAGYSADFKTASILDTGYADNWFDCVISRDVLDHICKADAIIATKELCRITKPGGIVLLTLDSLDEEYETETHIVNEDGDYVFTDGKWNGMVFHPYDREEVCEIIPTGVICEVTDNCGELTVVLRKNPGKQQ